MVTSSTQKYRHYQAALLKFLASNPAMYQRRWLIDEAMVETG
jgi:hypothetical protein